MHIRLTVRRLRGFTLIEVLIATAIMVAILVITCSVINSATDIWRRTNAKIHIFQDSRLAFEVMTKRLSQATLNTYWDYYDASFKPFRTSPNSAAFLPAYYGRYSDLDFVCGRASSLSTSPVPLLDYLPDNLTAVATQAVFFTAPTGLTANAAYSPMPDLLTTCGYFVAFGNDDPSRPAIYNASSTYRWRLMEVSTSAESLQVFDSSTGNNNWFTAPIKNGNVRPLADNIIALVVWPRPGPLNDPDGTGISSNYSCDSRTNAAWTGTPPVQPVQACQLPPTLQITMVAIDEADALHIQNGTLPPSQITYALNNLFEDVSQYDDDLQTLKTRLHEKHINYKIFTTTVTLPESRWN